MVSTPNLLRRVGTSPTVAFVCGAIGLAPALGGSGNPHLAKLRPHVHSKLQDIVQARYSPHAYLTCPSFFRHKIIHFWNSKRPELSLSGCLSKTPRSVAFKVPCSSLKARNSSLRIRSSSGPAERHAAIHCFSCSVGFEGDMINVFSGSWMVGTQSSNMDWRKILDVSWQEEVGSWQKKVGSWQNEVVSWQSSVGRKKGREV